jgi:tetratricopeptide (TPR) repeat protein
MRVGSPGEVNDSDYAATGLTSPTKAQNKEVNHSYIGAHYPYQQGLSAYNVGNYTSAMVFWSKALVLYPGDPETVHARAVAYFMLGDYKSSLADSEAAVLMNPHDGEFWYMLGFMRGKQGDMKGSMEAYRKCMKCEGENGNDNMRQYYEMAKTRLAKLEGHKDDHGTHRGTGIQGVVAFPTQIKVKVDCYGDYVMLVVGFDITYDRLADRIFAKLGGFTDKFIAREAARLRYRNKNGGFFTIESDEGIQIVFQAWREAQKSQFYHSGQLEEIELFCTSVAEIQSLHEPQSYRNPTPAPKYRHYRAPTLVPVPPQREQKSTERGQGQNRDQLPLSTSQFPLGLPDPSVSLGEYWDPDIGRVVPAENYPPKNYLYPAMDYLARPRAYSARPRARPELYLDPP